MTRLLTADEVAERLGVKKDWYGRRLGPNASRTSSSAATAAPAAHWPPADAEALAELRAERRLER